VQPAVATACRRLAATCAALLLLPGIATADLIVPANGVVSLNGAVVDLACTDLVVAGTLQLGAGQVLNARHVVIQAGGVVDGGSGTLELGGDWTNGGGFLAGTGTVRFADLCGLTSATIAGNNEFRNARFVSATGKTYVFAIGATQTVTGVLQISGTTPQPIQFRSSVPGQVAYINLTGTGTQQIQHVGVTDVWATGQWLAPGQQNEGGGGNANRWFGNPQLPAVEIPMLGAGALALLAALLALSGWALRRREERP
jgi:hypothetical protein